MKTITVENSFGKEIQLTQDQFVKRWLSDISSLPRLIECEQDVQDIAKIQSTVARIARNTFDSVYERQSK